MHKLNCDILFKLPFYAVAERVLRDFKGNFTASLVKMKVFACGLMLMTVISISHLQGTIIVTEQ